MRESVIDTAFAKITPGLRDEFIVGQPFKAPGSGASFVTVTHPRFGHVDTCVWEVLNRAKLKKWQKKHTCKHVSAVCGKIVDAPHVQA